MWRAIFENPIISKVQKEKLAGKGITALMDLTGAASEGDLDSDDWDNVIKAPDRKSILEIVRENRKDETRGKKENQILNVTVDMD